MYPDTVVPSTYLPRSVLELESRALFGDYISDNDPFKKKIDLIDTLKVALLSRGTLAKRALVRIRVEINERKVLERELRP